MQYFYYNLDLVNIGVANQLVHGGLWIKSHDLAVLLLDDMT